MFSLKRRSKDDIFIPDDPKDMSEAQKEQAYIRYRSKKIDEMRRVEGKRIRNRMIFFWRDWNGGIFPSRQSEYSDFMKDCEDYRKYLYLDN